MYVAKRRSFGDAVMSEKEFDRLASRLLFQQQQRQTR
jgi:hypothetical protein